MRYFEKRMQQIKEQESKTNSVSTSSAPWANPVPSVPKCTAPPPPVEPVKNIYSTVLPPIPKGYELQIVGGITSIAPITKVTGSKRK